MSKIEWTDLTWNVTSGCDKIAPECDNCYALGMSHRLASNPLMGDKYKGTTRKLANGEMAWTGELKMHEDALAIPTKWKKPKIIFVNSMSDLFHEKVEFDFIRRVLWAMKVIPRHYYLLLTKRPDVALNFIKNWERTLDIKYGRNLTFKEIFKKEYTNVGIGVSAGSQPQANRVLPDLLRLKEYFNLIFLSAEPLLGEVDLSPLFNRKMYEDSYKGTIHEKAALPNIDWVITGGESGHKARPMHPDWVRGLRDQCQAAQVPFFFKQWGEWVNAEFRDYSECKRFGFFDHEQRFVEGATAVHHDTNMFRVGKHASGRLLDGKEHSEYPIQIIEHFKKLTHA